MARRYARTPGTALCRQARSGAVTGPGTAAGAGGRAPRSPAASLQKTSVHCRDPLVWQGEFHGSDIWRGIVYLYCVWTYVGRILLEI